MRRSSGCLPLLVLIAALAFGGFYVWGTLKRSDPCVVALEALAGAPQGDLRRALALANQAVTACNAGPRAEQARAAQRKLEAQANAAGSCERALRDSATQTGNGRPRQALRTLAAQDAACQKRPEAVTRRTAAETARQQAADQLTQANAEIARRAHDSARALIDAAERLDRENPDLAAARRTLAAAANAPDPDRAARAVDALLRAAAKDDWPALEPLSRELRIAGGSVDPGDRAQSDRENAAGQAALQRRDAAAALAAFRRAVVADATSADAQNNLGRALLQQGQPADAGAALIRALALAPNRSSAWADYAELLALGGRDADAAQALRLALRYAIDRKVLAAALARQRDSHPNPRYREVLKRVLAQDPVSILLPPERAPQRP